MQAQPQPQIDQQLLQMMLQQEAIAAQQAAGGMVPQDAMGEMAGVQPQLLATFRQQSLPPVGQSPPLLESLKEWKGVIMVGMGCITALVMTPMIAASLPGSRGTAELNTAVMALSDAAVQAQRPNMVCVGFGCGKFGEAIAQSAPPPAPVAAMAPVVATDPARIEHERVTLIAALRNPNLTATERTNIQARLNTLGGQ